MKNNFGISNCSLTEILNLFNEFDTLKKVYIFGSSARGDYKIESDIDLSIESETDIKLRLLNKLNDVRYILKFDVVDMNNLKNEKLLSNIRKDGILIYEKD